jgi:hypothetical protein
MIHTKRVRWNTAEAKLLLQKMIELEGFESIVCPGEPGSLSGQHRRRKQGFFQSLGIAVATKSGDQCKAKLQKFQEKFRDRLDLLGLDQEHFIDAVLEDLKSGDEKNDSQVWTTLSQFDESNNRQRRICKKKANSIKQSLPFSPQTQSTGPADESPHPSTVTSRPDFKPNAKRSDCYIDFSDGRFFANGREEADFQPADLDSNSELHQSVQPKLTLDQIQTQIMFKWAQISADVTKALEMMSRPSNTCEVQGSFKLISEQFGRLVSSLDRHKPVANDLLDMLSMDLSVFDPN